MKCPYCSHRRSRVLDSREAGNSSAIRRRRVCPGCRKRFTTYERAESPALAIVKKDGRREPFSREKLLRGILIACEKRPIRREAIENAVDWIELALRKQEKTEIPSKTVGELVIRRLKKLDKVAYVRFASVYREFKDIKEFMAELKRLKKG